MEGYTALYRKLRPSRFSEIIGQPHISRIMVNALNTGRVGHAYLFSGPRGTGKTTTAKILAKAVNCLNPQGVEPCNECAACLRITKGHSLDVLEIDGASNRGIDEIRELREKVRLTPAEEKTKVYIIDEVHMLTGEAFNALLKTLEEPPAQVIFILATTEPHKVPDTILSRCLRLDFRRIPQGDIIEYLENVARLEGVEVESQAIKLIAKMARGGLRDALSIFEQCLAFNQDRISQQDVETVLGKAGDKVMQELFDCIGNVDVAGALTVIEDCITRGSEAGGLFGDIMEYIRNLLLLKTSRQADYLIPYSDEIVREMQQHVELYSRKVLFEMANLVSDYSRQVRWTNQPQIILELAVIKLCEYGTGAVAGTAKVRGDAVQDTEVRDAKTRSDAKVRDAKARDGAKVGEAKVPDQDIGSQETAVVAEDALPKEQKQQGEQSGQLETEGQSYQPGETDRTEELGETDGFLEQPVSSEEETVSEAEAAIESLELAAAAADSSEMESTAPEATEVVSVEGELPHESTLRESSGEISLENIKRDWSIILEQVKMQKISLQAILREGSPEEFSDNRLTVVFGKNFSFHKETAEQPNNKSCLEGILKEHFGTTIIVRFELSHGGDNPTVENSKQSDSAGGVVTKKQEMVNKAMEVFGGELVPMENTVMGQSSNNEEGF